MDTVAENQDAIPEGISSDARETWPHPELIQSWLGDAEVDFELRPGEEVVVHDDPAAQAAARRFRDVLGCFGSGITVVTTMSGDEPVGMTCQSFSSVSLDPPLITFIPARTSRAWPLIQRAGRFCVNVLADDHQELAGYFAGKQSDMSARYAAAKWVDMPSGSQALADAMVSFDCRLAEARLVGTHHIFIGQVMGIRSRADGNALLYFDRNYINVPSQVGSFGG